VALGTGSIAKMEVRSKKRKEQCNDKVVVVEVNMIFIHSRSVEVATAAQVGERKARQCRCTFRSEIKSCSSLV
jgi:hypothetical protein